MYEIVLINGETRKKLHEMASGSDRKAAACVFTDGVNLVPSADIIIYPQNPVYDSIFELSSKIEIINTKTGNVDFEGRVLKIPASGMDSSGVIAKKITCEGFMSYLYDTAQVYHKFNTESVSSALSYLLAIHNSQVPEEKKIYIGSCNVSGVVNSEVGYAQTFSEIKRLLLDVFGGELSLRRSNQNLLVLDYVQSGETSVVSDTTIELAKNIVSLNVETDATHVITRLFPYGQKIKGQDGRDTGERLTITDVTDGYLDPPDNTIMKHGTYIEDESAVAQYGVVSGIVTYDDIDSAQTVCDTALAYMRANNRIRKSYKADVLDLSLIGLEPEALISGKTYRFKHDIIGLDDDLRLVKRTVNIYKPYQPSVEIGDKTQKITATAARVANFIEYELPKVETSILDTAKDIATSLIQNATNGYVVFHDSNNDGIPDEILIMDAPTTSAATKVWRWNSSGLGYSSTGYNGTYGLAMTMNGAIVADFITTGVLRSLQIINGTNGQFSVDISGNCVANAFTSSNATITGGSLTVSGTTGSVTVGSGKIDFYNTSNNLTLEIFGNGTFRAWSATAGNWFSDSFEGIERTIVDIYDRLSDHSNRIYALEQAVFN